MAQIHMVVNFTIKGHDIPLAGRAHGLMPGCRQIHNGQPPVSQRYTCLCIDPSTRIIGAAVGYGFQRIW